MVLLFSGSIFAQDRLRSIPDPDPEYQLSTLYPAEGFEVNLYASEPMVEKPIQMNWDEKGRLWVVGSSEYPQPKPGAEPTGKIFVLEDRDGDGRADTSILFADGLRVPTAVLPGDGGVYVANSTEILHLKDTDGDGKADESRVVLSGFGTGDTHHLIHTFRWGPGGSFYFNQSIYIYSHVETPHGVRRLEGGGVWRYRTATQELDVYVRGLVNPWGLQFNKYGQSFLTDGAGTEGINYGFQGATFMTAPGARRILQGLNPGQPKHSGLDIITSRHMPQDWRGTLVTNDFRANRINRFTLEKLGSGYTSRQEPDLLYSNNVAFRPVDILEGPDGAIYVADWYNPIIQHGEVDFRDPRRDQKHGRIWRITRKNSPLVEVPHLPGASNRELLDFLSLPEAWTRDQARRLLKERGRVEVKEDLDAWIAGLSPENSDYDRLILEGFWVYQSLDIANQEVLEKLLNSSDPFIRAAAIRGLYFQYNLYPEANDYLSRGLRDEDAVVRLESVIALRKSKDPGSASLATIVLEQEMDTYLDFALWQTIRELESKWYPRFQENQNYFQGNKRKAFALKSITSPAAVTALVDMYRVGQFPEEYESDLFDNVSRYGAPSALSDLFRLMIEDQDKRVGLLKTLIRTMEQRGVKPDIDLSPIVTLFNDPEKEIAQLAVTAAGLWGMESYRHQFIEWARSKDNDISETGITALANLGDSESLNALLEFSDQPYSDERRVKTIIKLIPLDAKMATSQATTLLASPGDEENISQLLSAFFANQNGLWELVQTLENTDVSDQSAKIGMKLINSMSARRRESEEIKSLMAVFGKVPIEEEKATMPQQLSAWDADRLELDVKAYGDPFKGEIIYRKLGCAACHAIGGAGGKLGTDLSSLGANAPTDYIISSILDPGREIKDGYELNQIIKKNGNVVMGYFVRETDSEVVLRDVAGKEVAVPKFQISSHDNVPGSLMPPGLTSGLTREEFVDLIGFLSKIGEPGDFRVPAYSYVRYWEALRADDSVVERIDKDGEQIVVEEQESFSWVPIYSKVSGGLPLEEIPGEMKALKFAVEVAASGQVMFAFDPQWVEHLWVDDERYIPGENGLDINLDVGIREIIVFLKSDAEKGDFKVEVKEGNQRNGRAHPLHTPVY